MTAALFTRYRGTPLSVTREELIPGLVFWVVEPHGYFVERDAQNRRMSHRLGVRAGTELEDALGRAVADMDTLDVLR